MLTLFDEIVRTEKSARNRRQSFYASLNRSVGAEYDAIRQVLETWFCDYPSDPEQSRSLLQGKFRSDNNQNHLSAFFELYLYALLKHQAFVVSPEFVVDRVVGRPIDFRIQPTDALPFYLEAVVAMDSEAEIESEKRLNELRQSLRMIDDPNFLLDFKWERKSAKPLPTAQMRSDLQKWLQELDPHVYASGEKIPEPAFYDQNGWKLFFYALPRSRQGHLKHPILGQPLSAQWTPFKNSLRKNLEEKAEKERYGHLEYPYVIAVNILALDSLSCDLDEVFFGKEVYQFNKETGEGMTTRSTLLHDRPYRENGFWLARGRWRNEHVSAVLLVSGLLPLSIAHTTPILWHNPKAAKPLNPDIWQGPQMILDQITSEWNSREGKNAREMLCLPQTWPSTNP